MAVVHPLGNHFKEVLGSPADGVNALGKDAEGPSAVRVQAKEAEDQDASLDPMGPLAGVGAMHVEMRPVTLEDTPRVGRPLHNTRKQAPWR
jgi:hypothetical protein